jgi:GAF domain-containing protein
MTVASDVKAVHNYLDENVKPTIEKIITPIVEARNPKPKRAVLESLAEALGLPQPSIKTTRSEREANQQGPGDGGNNRMSTAHRMSQRGTVYKRESRVQNFFNQATDSGSDGRELQSLFESTKRITNEIVPQRVNEVIVEEIRSMMRCNRVGLYVITGGEKSKMFVLTRNDLDQPSRIQVGKGLVGYVYEMKRGHAASDIRKDKLNSMYNEKYDLPVYDGGAIVCHPIMDFDEECLGVLEAVSNKPFSERQRLLLHQVSQYCAIAIRNAMVYREAIMQHERANGLLNVAKTLGQNLDMKTTITTISGNAAKLVGAEKCVLYLCDHTVNPPEFWTSNEQDGGKELRVPTTGGLLGKVMETMSVLKIDDAYQEPLFDKGTDIRAGTRTKNMLFMPVVSQVAMTLLGVIQLVNRREVDGTFVDFEEEDIDLMDSFANYVSSEVESSGFLQKASPKKSPQKNKLNLPM